MRPALRWGLGGLIIAGLVGGGLVGGYLWARPGPSTPAALKVTPTGTTCRRSSGTLWSALMSVSEFCDTVITASRANVTIGLDTDGATQLVPCRRCATISFRERLPHIALGG